MMSLLLICVAVLAGAVLQIAEAREIEQPVIESPDRAFPSELELEFEGYFGGLHIGSARTLIRIDGKEYAVDSRVRARGILDFLSSWKGRARSSGLFNPEGGTNPDLHRNEGHFRDEERSVVLTYLENGDIDIVAHDSDEDPDPVSPIPPDSLAGSLDPISATLAFADSISRGQSCAGTLPIFDGRRRYDVIVTHGPLQTFKTSDYSIFSGEAQACDIEIDRIGGYRLEPSKYAESANRKRIWIAAPLENMAPIPVRVQIETDYGNLVVHLTAIRSGQQEIALNPGIDNLAD